IRIGAVVEQIGAEGVVAILGRDQQRTPAVSSGLIDVGACREQGLDGREIVRPYGIDERRQLAAVGRRVAIASDAGRERRVVLVGRGSAAAASGAAATAGVATEHGTATTDTTALAEGREVAEVERATSRQGRAL